jgi:hypothetical protein
MIEQLLLPMIREGYEDTIYHLPDSPYRTFALWSVSDQNPHLMDSLHGLGIPQFAKLTAALLGDFVTHNDEVTIAQASVPMNSYLIFEVASDDLALHLAPWEEQTPMGEQRRELLYFFNQATLRRLRGDRTAAHDLLAPVHQLTDRISNYEQSLNPHKHRTIAATYLKERPEVNPRDLEQAIWPRLVANIETCSDALEVVSPILRPLVQEGLVGRYEEVNTLLTERDIPLSSRVHIGTQTILVIPTLGYYISVLMEHTERLEPDALSEVIENRTLYQALYNAALLVRLANDLGTELLTQTPQQRKDFIAELQTLQDQHGCSTLGDLILFAAPILGTVLTRLRKDVEHGEFNIGLHDLAGAPATPETLAQLSANLAYFSRLRSQSHQRMQELLAQVSTTLNTTKPENLVQRFVLFHEQLYRYHFTEPTGEYTV